MSIPILQTCKRRNRAPKMYPFTTFCDPGTPIKPIGAFRNNIRVFVRECAEIEDYTVDSMPVWCTLLVKENRGIVVPLYIIEENVKFSEQPFCDHCRFSGWSHHYMSKRKYHVIVPLDSEWNKGLNGDDMFHVQTHLLHGVVHCNGFGHLLSINGIEGGSKYVGGKEIMDLWDRICSNLHARQITVEDTSKKGSMELRLLYGIAYGQSWFGNWGYKFSRGSFAVQEHHYLSAVEILSSVNLDDMLSTIPKKNLNVTRIISSYRELSKTPLISLSDLFKFMLTMKSQTSPNDKSSLFTFKSRAPVKTAPAVKRGPISSKPVFTEVRRFASVVASMDTRWPKRRLEYAADVIVNALKEHSETSESTETGMTRQEVRNAARLHIGDTGLLDNVMKLMNNVIVGNYIVRRLINPTSKILEYTIHKLGENSSDDNELPRSDKLGEDSSANNKLLRSDRLGGKSLADSKVMRSNRLGGKSSANSKLPRSDLSVDMNILYKHMVDQPVEDICGLAVCVILDAKQFVKEWPFNDENDQFLRFICRVIIPTPCELDEELSRNRSTGELIVIPLHSSISDLKFAVQESIRDTYCVMEDYVVSSIESFDSMIDAENVSSVIESGSEVLVRGTGIDYETEFRYEAGPDNWTVKCSCGATDDDGERMVACDICEVWHHTRCSGIEDSDVVAPLFLCQICCSTLMAPKTESVYYLEGSQDTLLKPEFRETWLGIHC